MSILQSSACHYWGCARLSPTPESSSALLSKICLSHLSPGLPFVVFVSQSLLQASWELRTGASHKRVREKPVTQAPAEFVFHVLICNHFVFYEGYFLKLCQHDGNICGALIHDVTLLVERWEPAFLWHLHSIWSSEMENRWGVGYLIFPQPCQLCSLLRKYSPVTLHVRSPGAFSC